MTETILTTRDIPHGEAQEIAQRLINSHFRQEPCARIGIPARPDYDDDLLIHAYIGQQMKKEDETERLRRREAELLEANNRYLERARDAEAKLADADAATIAMEAKVVDLEQTIARAHAILDQAPGMESKGDLFGLADAVVRAWEELGGDAGPKRGG